MKLELSEQEVKLVMLGLGELKAKEVFNILISLQRQVAEHKANSKEVTKDVQA